MENNNEHHGDLWYKQVKIRLSTNATSSKFIGHCCKLKVAIENSAKTAREHCAKITNGKQW